MKLWVDFPFNSIIQCGHLLHLRSSIIHVSAELIKASVPAAYGIYSRLAWFVYVKTDLTQWKLRKSHYPLFSFIFFIHVGLYTAHSGWSRVFWSNTKMAFSTGGNQPNVRITTSHSSNTAPLASDMCVPKKPSK